MNAASSLVRRWVDLYTRGLATELRTARRAEIESDLWAQSEEADEIGRPPLSVDAEMLTRLVLGIPADIGWRLAHRLGNAPSPRKEIVMREPRSRQVWTAIGVIWAALGLVFAVVLLVDIQGHHADRPGDLWTASVAACVIIAGSALALVGLLRIGQNPTAGRQIALVGAVIAGGTAMLLLSWMWVIGFVLAAPLVVIAIVRAHQVTQAGRSPSA